MREGGALAALDEVWGGGARVGGRGACLQTCNLGRSWGGRLRRREGGALADDCNNQLTMMGIQPRQSQEGKLRCCPRRGNGGGASSTVHGSTTLRGAKIIVGRQVRSIVACGGEGWRPPYIIASFLFPSRPFPPTSLASSPLFFFSSPPPLFLFPPFFIIQLHKHEKKA